jgi:hypothetical protein
MEERQVKLRKTISVRNAEETSEDREREKKFRKA